jgi:Protein kinase domain
VRLLDFGLAQMAEFDTLTAAGDVPGTLAYISPERLLGRNATPAADVWSVGVILWEALAGEHPFWEGGVTGTSRRIQEGAEPLEGMRPDLPQPIHDAVASALLVNPARRPEARALAETLRSLPRRRRRRRGKRPTPPTPVRARAAVALPERVLPAALAGVSAGWVASALPFYPAHWPLGIAAVATALGFVAPRAGLAVALATPILPLGNISLGLAVVYTLLALAWLALTWNDARVGLLAAVGPILAPLSALALAPLAAQAARGRARKAAHAAVAVILAAVVAGIRRAPLPFDGTSPPLGLGIAGSDRPAAVLDALWTQLSAHPALATEAVVLAVAAAALPGTRARGPWAAAIFGGALLAGTVVAAPEAAALPLVAAAWVTAAALAFTPKN